MTSLVETDHLCNSYCTLHSGVVITGVFNLYLDASGLDGARGDVEKKSLSEQFYKKVESNN